MTLKPSTRRGGKSCPEIRFIAVILKGLNAMDFNARDRVLNYVISFHHQKSRIEIQEANKLKTNKDKS